MVSIPDLKQRLADGEDWVLFDSQGDSIDISVPPDIGPATLLVGPVIEALKTTTSDGLVDQSLNRDDIWAVKGFALNRVVVDQLESSAMSPREIYDAVSNLSYGWQIKVMAKI